MSSHLPQSLRLPQTVTVREVGLRELGVGSFVPARLLPQLAGIGGCPHAPGASGDVATGLDFDALLALPGVSA